MCPHFDKLDEIFGTRISISPPFLIDSAHDDSQSQEQTDDDDIEDLSSNQDEEEVDEGSASAPHHHHKRPRQPKNKSQGRGQNAHSQQKLGCLPSRPQQNYGLKFKKKK